MSAPAISPAAVEAMVEALSGINGPQILADFRSGNTELEIGDALLVAQEGATVAGYFVPEAASAAQWIGLARALLPVLIPAVEYANAHLPPPHRLQPNEYEAWGHVFTR